MLTVSIRFLAVLGCLTTELKPFVGAIPYFHAVNNYDANGNVCPLYSESGACPAICVTSVDLCPPEFNVTCPTKSVYCGDMTCQDAVDSEGWPVTNPCAERENICDCADSEYVSRVDDAAYLPCNMTALEVTTAAQTHMEREQLKVVACASMTGIPLANVLTSYGPDNGLAETAPLWLQCAPKPVNPIVRMLPVIFFWTLVIGFLFCLVVWANHKAAVEREIRIHDTIRLGVNDPSQSVSKHFDEHDSSLSNEIESRNSAEASRGIPTRRTSLINNPARAWQFGYVDVHPGRLMRLAMSAISWTWMIVFILLINDYYAQLDKTQHLFEDRLSLSWAFVIVWHMAAVWFVVIFIYRAHVDNFFRVRCELKNAEYVKFRRSATGVRSTNFFTKYLKKLMQVDVPYETCEVRESDSGSRYIVFECLRYVFNPEVEAFEETSYHFPNSSHTALLDLGRPSSGGLSTEQVAARRAIVGTNTIEMPYASLRFLIREEFRGGFYIYQGLALTVWYFFNFFLMAFVQTVVIIFAGLVNAFAQYDAHKSIRKIAESVQTVNVLRNNEWTRTSSTQIVPGDIVEVEVGMEACCDAVLVNGEAVVDESSLTGESMPLHKTQLIDNHDLYVKRGVSRKYTILAGSQIRAIHPSAVGERVLMLAMETGAWTEQGDMIRRILFPNPVEYQFTQQLPLVFMILFVWGVFAFGFSVFLMHQGNVQSWFYGALGITQIISPMLPTVLVVGQTVAAARLQKAGIWCVDFSRIAMGGSLQTFCFDKTGTLTSPDLLFDYALAVIFDAQDYSENNPFSIDESDTAVVQSRPTFSGPVSEAEDMTPDLLHIIATCHSVMAVGTEKSIAGNRVDVELLTVSGWSLTTENDFLYSRPDPQSQSGDAKQEFVILKRFEFEHERGTMCVIALDTNTYKLYVFCKGSVEKVTQLCRPSGIPNATSHVVKSAAKRGAYVLAVAHKMLGTVPEPNLTTEQGRERLKAGLRLAKGWTYQQATMDMDLVGLIFLENQVKSDSHRAVESLHRGGVRCVMLTGDNIHTAVHVAQRVGMVTALGSDQDPPRSAAADTSVSLTVDQSNHSAVKPRLLIGTVEPGSPDVVKWVDFSTDREVLQVDEEVFGTEVTRKNRRRRFRRPATKRHSPQNVPLLGPNSMSRNEGIDSDCISLDTGYCPPSPSQPHSTDQSQSTGQGIGEHPSAMMGSDDDDVSMENIFGAKLVRDSEERVQADGDGATQSGFDMVSFDAPSHTDGEGALKIDLGAADKGTGRRSDDIPTIAVEEDPVGIDFYDTNISDPPPNSGGLGAHTGVELAITGKAFDVLKARGELARVLSIVRVFAEMTPREKKECVEAYMSVGVITGMCGDGGNDSGALRAANIGMARGGDFGTVVASFASQDRTVAAVTTLVQEARGALCNAMSLYKYTVATGQVVTIAGFVSYYFTVASSQWVWLSTLVDSLLFSYTLSLCRPRRHSLYPEPPSAALLDARVIYSVVALVAVDTIVLLVAVGSLFFQPWFLCNEFNGHSQDIDTATWWELGDNFESSVISLVVLFQTCFTGMTYSLGLQHRQEWHMNWPLVAVFVVSVAFFTYLLIADPNYCGCEFRINCGDYEVLTAMNLTVPSNAGPTEEKYHSQFGHNIFPMSFRISLLVLMIINFVLNIVIEVGLAKVMDNTPIFSRPAGENNLRIGIDDFDPNTRSNNKKRKPRRAPNSHHSSTAFTSASFMHNDESSVLCVDNSSATAVSPSSRPFSSVRSGYEGLNNIIRRLVAQTRRHGRISPQITNATNAWSEQI